MICHIMKYNIKHLVKCFMPISIHGKVAKTNEMWKRHLAICSAYRVDIILSLTHPGITRRSETALDLF